MNTLVPVAGLVDSLRFAADKSFRSQQVHCQWDWMTCLDEPVTASCGMPISPTKPLNVWAQYDYIVIASGLMGETRNPPQWLLDALRDLHAAKVPIIALCSASFVLGKAGLLDGKRCAMHFTILDEFKTLFPGATAVLDKSYVDDGGIITCPGGTAIDLAASLISRHCGAVRTQKGLEYLLVEAQTDTREQAGALPSIYENDRVSRASCTVSSWPTPRNRRPITGANCAWTTPGACWSTPARTSPPLPWAAAFPMPRTSSCGFASNTARPPTPTASAGMKWNGSRPTGRRSRWGWIFRLCTKSR